MGRKILRGSIPVCWCIEHLRRHPMPEIMDDDCVAALENIDTQFGETLSEGYGLEVRLGDEARYVDFILKGAVKDIPLIDSHWIEIDYEQFSGKKPVNACYFAQVKKNSDNYHTFLDRTMPVYAGEECARTLRPALERLLAALPASASIKLVGVMASRGKTAGLRLVLDYPDFSTGADNLSALGWPGDTAALRQAFAPWVEAGFSFGFAVDVFPDRIGEKLGLETYWSNKSPDYVETVIDRLERAGLCLPSKGAALRRWGRIPPFPDPEIFTHVSYIKLNYLQGRITEAKAYLEGSSNSPNAVYPAYELPLRLDMELSDGQGHARTDEDVLTLVEECCNELIYGLRFLVVEERESLPRFIAAAREGGIYTEISLQGRFSEPWLRRVMAAKPNAFLVEAGTSHILETLQELGAGQGHDTELVARWFLSGENCETLPQVMKEMDALGVNNLLITGMTPYGTGAPPTPAQMRTAADHIWDWRFQARPAKTSMGITIESCFPVMQSMMGLKTLSVQPRMGFECGCSGGRTFAVARADGTFSPCVFLPGETAASLIAYWNHAERLKEHRATNHQTGLCDGCKYSFRCAPCPAVMPRTSSCPLQSAIK